MTMDAAGLLLDDIITTVYERIYVNYIKENVIIFTQIVFYIFPIMCSCHVQVLNYPDLPCCLLILYDNIGWQHVIHYKISGRGNEFPK